MAEKNDPDKPIPPPGTPPHYQPSIKRKLIMMGLCVLGLIFVWIFYWMETKTP